MNNLDTPESGQGKDLGTEAKEAARNVSQELKTRARDLADTVESEAVDYADQTKGAAADEVGGVASALRTAAKELRSGSPQERTFSQIADGLAEASEAMRDKDLGELMGSLNGFAKRNPLIFLGSAALVGFAATRFAKASRDGATGASTSRTPDDPESDMARPVPSDRSDLSNVSHVRTPAIHHTTTGGQT